MEQEKLNKHNVYNSFEKWRYRPRPKREENIQIRNDYTFAL